MTVFRTCRNESERMVPAFFCSSIKPIAVWFDFVLREDVAYRIEVERGIVVSSFFIPLCIELSWIAFGPTVLYRCDDNEFEFPNIQATKKQNVAFLLPKEAVSPDVWVPAFCLLSMVKEERGQLSLPLRKCR